MDRDFDCVWSAFNSFADPPEFKYATEAEATAALDKD